MKTILRLGIIISLLVQLPGIALPLDENKFITDYLWKRAIRLAPPQRPKVALVLGGARWPAWIGLTAFAAHLVWQIRRLDISDPALCLRVFKSNRDAGLLLFSGLLIDAVMRSAS